MKKEILNIDGVAKPPAPFNHVVKAGGFLFVTSQLSTDLKTNEILPGCVSEQARKALENLKFLVESAGSSMKNIVKVVIYMKDIADFDEINKVYKEFFNEGEAPARVAIQALSPIKGVDVEIEAVAVVEEK
ncbi:RidA family protein [Candidatus Woesearchaeota archaeon]|nr:MAG: RidA family protein [Candidatus Woesearchaeota archaeon]